MKKASISNTAQKVAVDILTQFTFARNMSEVVKVWNDILSQYNLSVDPFTSLPCTSEEYYKNKVELEKQIMIQLYGHCDGLE